MNQQQKILALTGPAGTAKTTTIRVLAREMGFDIMEWKNAIAESGSKIDDASHSSPVDGQPLFAKFEAFLNRASSCHNIFTTAASKTSGVASQLSQSSARITQRHIILLEDLPNILHSDTQTQFHSALQALVTLPISNRPVPVVIIVSDAGVRGEAADERISNGGGWRKTKEGIVDIRTVLPRDLLSGPFVTQIGFNPIAPTLLLKGLQALLHSHFSTSSRSPPSKEVLDAIVESANGDIRSAIMALQFACVVELSGKPRKKKGGGSEKDKTIVLESITRREQSKHDPSSSSATAKDVQKEKLLDAQLKDPPKLPPDFQEHERRASRINIDVKGFINVFISSVSLTGVLTVALLRLSY
ncbi:hypothetical protein H0H87_009562 [Tephrocybe sp. NHM501043]|nr:hypothetical protein H0H87_009562 [Tephrocybe sp. NHM501043]